MASDVKIAIKDEASARQWLEKVMLTNDDYYEAMREAGETLQGTKDFAEGTMVDEFYNLGTGMLDASQKVYSTINEISGTVNKVLGFASALTGSVTGAIDIVKQIFG